MKKKCAKISTEQKPKHKQNDFLSLLAEHDLAGILLSEDICKVHLRPHGPFLSTSRRPGGALRDAGHEEWKPWSWMPIRVSRDTWSPNPSLSLSSHLSFFTSGGSGCSGLHVLNRCVGIGENIKVKRKGAQKTPGNSATCVSIYMPGSQGGRGIYLHIQVKAKREMCRYLYPYTLSACVKLCIRPVLMYVLPG